MLSSQDDKGFGLASVVRLKAKTMRVWTGRDGEASSQDNEGLNCLGSKKGKTVWTGQDGEGSSQNNEGLNCLGSKKGKTARDGLVNKAPMPRMKKGQDGKGGSEEQSPNDIV